MFDAALYAPVYFHGVMALTLLTAIVYMRGGATVVPTGYNSAMQWIVVFTLVLTIGTRPISGAYFVDMATYAQKFEAIASGRSAVWGDPGFNLLTETCAELMTTAGYFLVCATLYFIPVGLATKRVHSDWGFAALLAFVGGFSFYSYSVNGLRNGIGTSILLLAFAYRDRKLLMLLLMALAVSMHKSVAIPAVAFAVAGFYSAPWIYAVVWMMALGATTALKEGLSGRLAPLMQVGGDDERLSTYVANAGFGGDKGGFRLDFVLYSIVPIIISYAMAGAAVRRDVFYRRLICAYLLSNAMWLCMMYAAFSNRFAYLSWFMMPWIAIYPFIPRMNPAAAFEQPRMGLLATGLIAHYLFTYIMILFVYGGRI